MDFPRRIVDLHTHLFNARYMPLASVIADAMGKDESDLANKVADLLVAITGSSYKEKNTLFADVHFLSDEARDEHRIDQIWQITKHELLAASGSSTAVLKGDTILKDLMFSDNTFNLLRKTNLSTIVESLGNIDYAAEGVAEGVIEEVDEPVAEGNELRRFDLNLSFGNILKTAENSVKKSLRAVVSLMDPEAWGERENYLEFFQTMLNSEEDMLEKLIDGYGSGLPSLQFTHFMMDLQMAYPGQRAPYYPFFPNQVDKMEALQHAHPAQVFGFCAFDPRRPGNWRDRAEYAMARGFIGFKFYPPLGYKPSGDKPEVQAITNEFFDYCVATDTPVFAHCTPQGFQTRLKEGANAHPNNWKAVLENDRWSNLRLCLGHAGGARIQNAGLFSPGWMAASDEEWALPDNFARIVTELCTTYPNVYCEVANMLPLLKADNGLTFVSNLERARAAATAQGRPFDLMHKIAYGTDWHMPDMVDNTRRYLEAFLEIMNRDEYKAHIDDFFWRNALSYLKVPE